LSVASHVRPLPRDSEMHRVIQVDTRDPRWNALGRAARVPPYPVLPAGSPSLTD